MELLQNPNHGETLMIEHSLSANNGGGFDPRFGEDLDSSSSTPYVSAPSSPGRGGAPAAGYYYSAPASPMHFVLTAASEAAKKAAGETVAGSFEFEFSARYPAAGPAAVGSMSSADELFFNGQIRPMKLSSHLQRPQVLTPLLDLDEEEEDESKNHSAGDASFRGRDIRLRSGSAHRRARSMSPMRNPRFQWDDEEERDTKDVQMDPDQDPKGPETETPSVSASSSRSSSTSSSGRNSKRWIFLKDLLYRSKSEGRANVKEKDKFWLSLPFSPALKSQTKPTPIPAPAPPPATSTSEAKPRPLKSVATSAAPGSTSSRRTGSVTGKRRGSAPSPHERLYTMNRAQAEEMRRRTFLPYRQGLLGCLGFSSRSYGAMNGLARTLNPVSSR